MVFIKNILILILIFTTNVNVNCQCSFSFDLGLDKELCIGDSVQLIAPSGYSYSWVPSYNISSAVISSPYVKPLVDTTYYVSVTDLTNCTVIDSINIFINPLPLVSVSDDDTICEGTTIQLIATGALSYTWLPNYNLSNNLIPYPIASPLIDTTYFLNGVDANGCTNQDTISVTVLPTPMADAGPDTSICPGSSLQLNASGGVIYQWINPISLSNYLISNPVSSPDDSIKYYVNVTDLDGCEAMDSISVNIFSSAKADAGFSISTCADSPVQLNASGGESYTWSPANYLNHSSLFNPLAFPDDDMDFIVQVKDSNGCFDNDTMRVTVFKISINNDTLFCKGDSMMAFVDGDPATFFLWSPSNEISDTSSFEPWIKPTETTTYTLKATNAQGCTYQDQLTITIPEPEALIDTNFIIGCEGAILELTNNSDPNFSFVWNFEEITNSTDSLGVLVEEFNMFFDQPFSYTTINTNLSGTYYAEVTGTFSGSGTCESRDACFLFYQGCSNITPLSGFIWNWNNVNPNTQSQASTLYNQNHLYQFYFTGGSAQTFSFSEQQQSWYNDNFGTLNFKIYYMKNTSSLSSDFTTSTLTEIDKIISYNSNLITNLSVVDENGCVDTSSINYNLVGLDFNDYFKIQVPNVFTPNNDGKNDLFKTSLPGRMYECATISIFNKWGQIQYFNDDSHLHWDGTNNSGTNAPEGTYFYTISIKHKSKSGTFQLFR